MKPEDWATLLCYMGKEDVLCMDLKAKGQKFLNIWCSETLGHALMAQEPDKFGKIDVLGTRVIFEAKKKFNFTLDEVEEPNNVPWYEEYKRYQRGEIKDYDNRRSIIWVCDQTGDSHKSHLAKWAFDKQDYLVVTALWRVTDFARICYKACLDGWTGKYVIICLPRDWVDDEGGAIYKCMETIKDGMITSNKYDSVNFRIPETVNVLVLSNAMPNMGKMTMDRWHIIVVRPDKTITRYGKLSTMRVNNVKRRIVDITPIVGEKSEEAKVQEKADIPELLDLMKFS